jgi:hypothetical protein
MSYQRPKWQSYTLPSWERPTILRDPPKSIHTKKKERVEMGDVTYMIRNDDSRINEGISYIARGVNPMVDVSYSNYGGNGAKLNSMPTLSATNPYKIMKDGAFRPPMMTQEDLLPLSRMRRPETSAITNPGISTLAGFVNPNLQNSVDLTTISNAIDVKKINYLSIRPSATFNISLPIDVDVFGSRAIQKNKMQFSHYVNPSTNLFDIPDYIKNTSDKSIINDAINKNNIQFSNYANPSTRFYNNPDYLQNTSDNSIINDAINKNNLQFSNYANPSTKFYNNPDYLQNTSDNSIINDAINQNNILVQNVSSNPNLKVYIQNGKDITEVQGSIKDKLNIAVQSRLGKPITINREDGTFIKIKDYVSKVVQTNASLGGGDSIILRVNNNEDNIQLNRNTPLHAATSNVTSNYKKQYENTTGLIELNSKLHTSAMSNINDKTMTVSNNANEYNYESQSVSKARGMGYIGGMVDTANGITRNINDNRLPDFSNVKKLTLAY